MTPPTDPNTNRVPNWPPQKLAVDGDPRCTAESTDMGEKTRCVYVPHEAGHHHDGAVWWCGPGHCAADPCCHPDVKPSRWFEGGSIVGKCESCQEDGFPIREVFADDPDATVYARIYKILGKRATGDLLVELMAALDEIVDWREGYGRTVSGDCPLDEEHCTCVPDLRRRIAELEAEVAALKAEAQNPYVLRIPEDGPRFWERECKHERTYEATVRVCRRCNRAVDPKPPALVESNQPQYVGGVPVFSIRVEPATSGRIGGLPLFANTAGGAGGGHIRILAPTLVARLTTPTPPHPTLGLLPLECQRHGIYGQSPTDLAPDKCEKCGYWTKL